jgi:hypothetical protein
MRWRRRALRNYIAATEIDSSNAAAWQARASLAASLGRQEEAEAAFRCLTELAPENAEAWRGRARASRLLGIHHEACTASANAVFCESENPDNWLERAQCLYDDGHRPEDALSAVLRAISLASSRSEEWPVTSWVQSYLIAGSVLLQLQRFEEALAAFEAGINLQSRSVFHWLGKGYALQGLGRSDEAIEAFQRARRLAYGSDAPGVPRSPVAAVRASLAPIVHDFWAERRKLLIPGVAYAAGLVVWSVNAHRNDLGAQASADLNYLVAGVVPGLLFLCLLVVALFLMAAPAWTSEWLSHRKRNFAGYLLLGALIAWFTLVFVAPEENRAFDIALLVLSIFLMITPFFLVPSGNTERLIWTIAVLVGSFVAVILVFNFYSDTIYPELPQSLGGGLPRCARLDIDTTSISDQTLKGLVTRNSGQTERSAETSAAADPQIRSIDVEILFARDDVLFVKRRDRKEAAGARPTHELRGDVVRAVVAC